MPFRRPTTRNFACVLIALGLLLAAPPGRADIAHGDAHTNLKAAMAMYRAGNHAASRARFYTLAATGNPEAEFMLGALYFYGQGVTRDLTIAALWFYKSARQGHPSAQLAFGSLHIRGDGVGQDLVKSYMWLQLAADSGVPALIPQAVMLRDEASQYMTAEQLVQADGLVRGWRPTPAGYVR